VLFNEQEDIIKKEEEGNNLSSNKKSIYEFLTDKKEKN
jgi:hypothetical protein